MGAGVLRPFLSNLPRISGENSANLLRLLGENVQNLPRISGIPIDRQRFMSRPGHSPSPSAKSWPSWMPGPAKWEIEISAGECKKIPAQMCFERGIAYCREAESALRLHRQGGRRFLLLPQNGSDVHLVVRNQALLPRFIAAGRNG